MASCKLSPSSGPRPVRSACSPQSTAQHAPADAGARGARGLDLKTSCPTPSRMRATSISVTCYLRPSLAGKIAGALRTPATTTRRRRRSRQPPVPPPAAAEVPDHRTTGSNGQSCNRPTTLRLRRRPRPHRPSHGLGPESASLKLVRTPVPTFVPHRRPVALPRRPVAPPSHLLSFSFSHSCRYPPADVWCL